MGRGRNRATVAGRMREKQLAAAVLGGCQTFSAFPGRATTATSPQHRFLRRKQAHTPPLSATPTHHQRRDEGGYLSARRAALRAKRNRRNAPHFRWGCTWDDAESHNRAGGRRQMYRQIPFLYRQIPFLYRQIPCRRPTSRRR